ncbi:hypothetical protein [Vampirovibrio chlorellavorus]|uniref:hypothetical protein n=1 Tax=Vampirovibrio chlorellavorus TaxID=758823 RepID=UPI0026F0CC99|nr:hypothetical protein [Vampirovibrio chlorellavorus]
MSQPSSSISPTTLQSRNSGNQSTDLPQNPANPSPPSIESLPPNQALELFVSDPFSFVRQIVDDAAKTHLADLKEEAELKSALNSFRKKSPEFARFEPFILQEVVTLLRDDPDGGTDQWETLLEKGLAIFSQKFQATLKEKMDTVDSEKNSGIPKQNPYMEAATQRQTPSEPPRFSRQQIAQMSLPEFLKNEAAINEALKNNRVQ